MEITVKAPRFITVFGIQIAWRYFSRQAEWVRSLPSNGERIRITYLPPCKNARISVNPYIGMEGIVEDMDVYGHFFLRCETNTLLCSGKNFKYEIIVSN